MHNRVGDDGGFTHDDVFPVIERLIREQFQKTRDYVSHAELTAALLSDEMGRKLIAIAKLRGNDWSDQDWANNMIAWFSQRITRGNTDYTGLFTRAKIKGRWAYKPLAAS
jgi:hypothetical protein